MGSSVAPVAPVARASYGSPSMKSLLPLVSLLALAAGRRHLCADLNLPVCGDGSTAVYRPVWRNKGRGNDNAGHGCSDKSTPTCRDGSTPRLVYNVCRKGQKQCPHGYGQGGGSKPFPVCSDGSKPLCPSGKPDTCTFAHKKCKNKKKPHRQCTKGKPHCPWFTRNRNHDWNHEETKFNLGPNRPQNKANGDARCPPQWTALDTGCYHLHEEETNFALANAACKRKNGYLVEIDTEAEQTAIFNWLKGRPVTAALIGLKLTSGTWVWGNSGAPLSSTGYSNWAHGQPSGGEDCTELYFLDGSWNDVLCNSERLSICELNGS